MYTRRKKNDTTPLWALENKKIHFHQGDWTLARTSSPNRTRNEADSDFI